MSIQHTPTPWKVDKRVGCLAIYPADQDVNCLEGAREWAIHYQHGEYKTDGWEIDPQKVANAEYIVKCCNSHEALISALKDCTETLEAMAALGNFIPNSPAGETLQHALTALNVSGIVILDRDAIRREIKSDCEWLSD